MRDLTKKILETIHKNGGTIIMGDVDVIAALDEMVSRNVVEFVEAKLPYSQMHIRVGHCDTKRDAV